MSLLSGRWCQSRRSNEGWHCRWPWVTFELHFRYHKRFLCLFSSTIQHRRSHVDAYMHEVNYNDRTSCASNYFYCQIQTEGFLYDVERNVYCGRNWAGRIPFVMIRLNFLPRDDSIKRGLSRHAVSLCMSVCHRVYFKRGVQPKCGVQNEKCGVQDWKMYSPK